MLDAACAWVSLSGSCSAAKQDPDAYPPCSQTVTTGCTDSGGGNDGSYILRTETSYGVPFNVTYFPVNGQTGSLHHAANGYSNLDLSDSETQAYVERMSKEGEVTIAVIQSFVPAGLYFKAPTAAKRIAAVLSVQSGISNGMDAYGNDFDVADTAQTSIDGASAFLPPYSAPITTIINGAVELNQE